MIRRDFLQAEIAKLAQALAKILSLKTTGNKQEADNLISKNLSQGFDLNLDELTPLNSTQLEELLAAKNFPTEKLDLLGQFLLERVSPFQQNPETVAVLNHVLTIYKILEQEHHTQSFENLNRKQSITKFLDSNNAYG
jgi:hypothetical protein